MLMFAFSLVVAFRFAIINCRNDSVEAFEPRERKKAHRCAHRDVSSISFLTTLAPNLETRIDGRCIWPMF